MEAAVQITGYIPDTERYEEKLQGLLPLMEQSLRNYLTKQGLRPVGSYQLRPRKRVWCPALDDASVSVPMWEVSIAYDVAGFKGGADA